MKNIFRDPRKSLAAKLIIAIGLLMVVGSFIFWFSILHKQEKDIMSIAVNYGGSFIDYVKRRTSFSMLTDHRAVIQQTLEDISMAEGVERVRIFDHDGNISYSTDRPSVGSSVDRDTLACRGCHVEAKSDFQLLSERKTWSVYKDSLGFTALKLVEPIRNEITCYTSDCHVHPQEQKILGFIEADMSLALLDKAKFKQGLALTAYVLVFFLAISVALGIILWKIVSKPVTELTLGMGKVAEGDFNYSVPIKSMDEIGVLTSTFNSMIKDIKAARDQRELWTQTLEIGRAHV